jgi:nucleotide-binding universal stress UspA family protein
MTAQAKCHIVVGVDGSKGAHAALEWAVDEARLRGPGTKLEVVHAWHYPYYAVAPTAPPMIDRAVLDEAAQRLLHDAVEQVDVHGLDVSLLAVPAPAAMVLVDRSEDADLVVVGSRGRGGFAGLVLGSVSQHVTAHARCPVTVVPLYRGDRRSSDNDDD